MFANDVALASARDGAPLDGGAVVVMEVCKARLDADENPVVGSEGFFEPDEMAGIAVMETGSACGERCPRGVAQPRMGVRRVQAGRPYPDRAQLPAVLRLPKPLQESDCLISFDALSKAPGN
jgi:hypothetical protein